MTFADPYLDPDSGILRNLPRIEDAESLTHFEAHAVGLRSQQLHVDPRIVERTWDARHWKAVHRHLFQDVYGWAGVFRTVDVTKGDHTFYPADRLDLAVDYIAGRLRTIADLEAPTIVQLAEPLAVVLGDMNEAHPFREGNGRTQREIVGMLAEHHGHPISWDAISPSDNIEASIASSTEPTAFGLLLRKAMEAEASGP
ncbi:Fic/DOC family protein [Ilumatobacter sp.]|uniref:Fic/DOC family protein n=1 Tax=Ilumatobacter sp. TaxID=1967498 RepID=UPI003752CB45